MTSRPFINCDWGTAGFRLRLVANQGQIRHEIRSDSGTLRLTSSGALAQRAGRFEEALEQGLAQLAEQTGEDVQHLPILVSGMASSVLGWQELPYARLPFALDGRDVVWREIDPHPLLEHDGSIYLISGVRSDDDLMRGEETEVLGAGQIAPVPLDDAILVLTGRHAKHVHVVQRRVVDFQTYMTGELYEVLSRHSQLRISLQGGDGGLLQSVEMVGASRAAFIAGVEQVADTPLPSALFHVRTRHVLQGHTAEENAAYLSGLLIGAELAGLLRCYPDDLPVILCAGEQIDDHYRVAAAALALDHRLLPLTSPDAHRLSALGQAVILDHISQLSRR